MGFADDRQDLEDGQDLYDIHRPPVCRDVDECGAGMCGVARDCVNLFGGYNCSACRAGYLDSGVGESCTGGGGGGLWGGVWGVR